MACVPSGLPDARQAVREGRYLVKVGTLAHPQYPPFGATLKSVYTAQSPPGVAVVPPLHRSELLVSIVNVVQRWLYD